MASFEEKVQEFISVTGVDEERAQFYLQSANGELHVALETFYDNDTEDITDLEYQSMHVNNAVEPIVEPSSNKSSEKVGGKNSQGRFATISTLHDEDDSEGEDGQAFYAGGSETSGQQILGPNRQKKKDDPTQELFDAAKFHGAEVVSDMEFAEKRAPQHFRGAGFKLGSDVEPSCQISPHLSAHQKSSEPKNIKIKFWKNGFSVGDGNLRDFDDPSNKEFLDSIKRGEVPMELRKQEHNGEVHVDMEDHRDEEYVKPKEILKPFTGAGHVLGSPTPAVVIDNTTAARPMPGPSRPIHQVDDSKPVTTIQLRFADGTRLVSKFNHHNTVGEIRKLMQLARPNTGNFNIMTTFPNKILDDDSKTISEAKLMNAVIVQRMI